MSMAFILIKRNIRLFFKDKGMFFTSLITPAILLILYVTFLGNVYRDSLTSNLPNSLRLSESIIEGLVGGQLISSILAVSCVTVAFCSNFLMVQDKANGTIRDLRISPVKSATLSLSYYVATLLAIKKAREKKGMTQEQLADIIGRDTRTVMYHENDGQHPSLDIFYQLATMFDLSVDEYFYPDMSADEAAKKRINIQLNSLNESELRLVEGIINAIIENRGTEEA